MKYLKIILILALTANIQGCSIQATSKLQEEIDNTKIQIVGLQDQRNELKKVKEELEELKAALAKAKAKWERDKKRFPEDVKALGLD